MPTLPVVFWKVIAGVACHPPLYRSMFRSKAVDILIAGVLIGFGVLLGAYGAPALAPHLTRGLIDAYHRYMAEYCAAAEPIPPR